MSYSRQYHQRIAVSYSGSVSYPASQNGGTAHYSGTEYEDVCINIDVDTTPFDNSVDDCNSDVNLLTGAVVATEAAQLVSIEKNSKKVAGTITDGFFGYIRSEISQQISELTQNINAQLIHLGEMAKRCRSKQKQMETDYNRITGRYLKIFEDLNNELSNRVHELNKPAFVFKNNCDEHANRTSDNDLVSTVAVFGSEGGRLHAEISASVAKRSAYNAVRQANTFLSKKRRCDATINQSMLKGTTSATYYSPVCFIETKNEKSQINRNLFQPDFLPQLNANMLIDNFQDHGWSSLTKEKTDNIQRYFNSEINNAFTSTSQHDNRVRDMIVRIFDLNSLECL